MNMMIRVCCVALLAIGSVSAVAETVLIAERSAVGDNAGIQYDFLSSGIKRTHLAAAVPVRGWQLADGAYFGQARVGDKWGVGFVFERGDTVYGVNHRGFEMKRRF